MKPRRVTIMLEVITEHSLKTLRDKEWWWLGMKDDSEDENLDILQVQANVIKKEKD